jgi:LuxR family maltose regulon positive regulatory protein
MDALAAGRDALRQGKWKEAHAHFARSLAREETPEALEQLGLTAWWLDDADATLGSRERAYTLYRERNDPLGAARVAIWLVWDYLAFRGDFAVASGWLERARRLLDTHHETPEYGWLLIREGDIALFRGHNPKAAIASAEQAKALGRQLGDDGVEFTALALQGLALVSTGDVAGGLRCLDEASVAATAGDVKELHAVGLVCCWQIFACERVRDYDRASQWCARVQEFTKRWGLHPLSALCRSRYAGVLIWRGEWPEAEAELTRAARELDGLRPGMTAAATARLGDLRLRQGRIEEATTIFHQVPSQPEARLGLATLALQRGDAAESDAILTRFLTELAAAEMTMRPDALTLAVRARLAKGDVTAARAALDELSHIAITIGTMPLEAAMASCRGLVERHDGEMATSLNCLERAVELFHQCGAPFECARARLDLADALASQGQAADAERELDLATATFKKLGAAYHLELVGRRSPVVGRAATTNGSALTDRQTEILRLIAQGLSNADIAHRLKLSEHTVKRHVANVLTRLQVSSRAAAVAYAAREGLLPARAAARS